MEGKEGWGKGEKEYERKEGREGMCKDGKEGWHAWVFPQIVMCM